MSCEFFAFEFEEASMAHRDRWHAIIFKLQQSGKDKECAYMNDLETNFNGTKERE